MVTKDWIFENVTLVGVLDADQSLYAQDYRAHERTFFARHAGGRPRRTAI